MPLLENLAQGFANATGATGAANDIQQAKNRRQNLSDKALEDTVQAHADVMKGLQAKLGQNPSDTKLQQALASERQQLFELLHPANNPDHLGRVQKLFRHVFRQGEPQQPANNLPSVEMMTAAAPAGQPDKFQEFKKLYREATGADPSSEQSELWAKKQGGIAEPVDKPTKYQGSLTETTDDAGKKHYWRVPEEEGGKPEEVDFGGQKVTPKGNSAPKVGSFGDFMVAAYGPHPTAQQYQDGRKKWAQANAGTTVGEHVILVPQPDNTVKAFTVTTTSHKDFGGGSPSTPSATKPPGEQKKDLQNMTKKGGAGISEKGKTVGGKRTTEQNKASNDFVEATKLDSIANQVQKQSEDAKKNGTPPDAFNQKRLAVALERASAGRFTTQALDYIKNVGWGASIEEWANKPTTGALPEELMRQLVDGAHENLKAAKDARDAAFPKNEDSGTGKTPAVGTIEDGYKFKGGNPSDKSSWEKQ